MSPRGGARPGSGRPKVTLAQLVEQRSWRASNSRHRQLLADDPVELADMELAYIRQRYQSTSAQTSRSFWAAEFERLIREVAGDD